MSKKQEVLQCKVCGSEFTPVKGQLDAYWAVNWCEGDHGKLCPPCHTAAEGLDCVSNETLPLGVCPFKSDIAKESEHVTEEQWAEQRSAESYQNWAKRNHPERFREEG